MRVLLAFFLLYSVNAYASTYEIKPNVVLILIDDLSHYGVTAYGSNRLMSHAKHFPITRFSTPNIDALAEEGIRVTHAYAHPLCENTRVALMTGKGNHRNYLQPKALHHSEITIGDAFKRAGYKTGLFGKWKQSRGTSEKDGKRYIAEFGFDEYTAFDVIGGGARMINPNLVVNGKVIDYKGRIDTDPQTGRRWFGPDIVNRDAREFVKKHKKEPFFLYYPMILVHDEHTPTPDSQPQYLYDEFPEAQYGSRVGDDKRFFPDMVEYMDKMVGQLIQTLEEQGVRENTLVVVMGDNGTKESFGHLLDNGKVYPARKGGNTENGIRVPLILSHPGKLPAKKGSESGIYSGMVDVTDIYPTLADFANIEIPKRELLDGVSFWPNLTKIEGWHREYIYRWYNANDVYTDFSKTGIQYVFNKDFKRYAPSKLYPKGRFFDLRVDLLERAGRKYKELRFKVRRYAGLNKNELTPEQQLSYDKMGKLLSYHQFAAVQDIWISNKISELSITSTHQLDFGYAPTHAQRTGSIWHSSHPNIVSIDKFGELTAHQTGTSTISLYSWSDAHPVSSMRSPDYFKDGIKDSFELTITKRKGGE